MLRGIKDEGDLIGTFMEARCDRGAEIAHMVFLSEGTAAAIRSLDEAVRVAKQRRGRWFDPELVDAFLRFRGDRAFWAALDAPDVSAWEPPDSILTGDDARLDRIAEAFARVIDAKSPFTARHSERVAELAAGIGSELGFDRDEVRPLRRAGLLHDIGKLAISNLILDKPGRLGEEEFAASRPIRFIRFASSSGRRASLPWRTWRRTITRSSMAPDIPAGLTPPVSISRCGSSP